MNIRPGDQYFKTRLFLKMCASWSLLLFTKYFKKLWSGHNFLSTELNETGTNFLNTFKKFSTTDFSNSFCLYFIDVNTNSVELNQLINLKLLNLLDMNYLT